MSNTEVKFKQEPVKQGGFSDELWNSYQCQQYVTSSCVAGYFGQHNRTIARDKTAERLLLASGLGVCGAAVWLTSTSARHMMDDVDRMTKPERFEAIVSSYVKHAFIEVTVWEHPDFEGSMGSRVTMLELLKKKVDEYFNAR